MAGGGTACLNVIADVEKVMETVEGDEKTGVKIVLKALEEPVRQIAANAGFDGGVIVNTIINSGKVDFVANAEERGELRAELASQSGNATEETRKEAGQEIGADLMLTGSLNSIVDQEGGEQVVFYQIDLQLVDIQTHKTVWIGDKKIKKYMSRSSVKM